MQYNVHDIVRMFSSPNKYRVWRVTAILLGAEGHENHYQLQPLDLLVGTNAEGKHSECLIPVEMLDNHTGVETV